MIPIDSEEMNAYHAAPRTRGDDPDEGTEEITVIDEVVYYVLPYDWEF